MRRNIFLLVFGLLVSFGVFSATPTPRVSAFQFNLGTHTEFYNALQDDDTGHMRTFDWAPTIGIGATFPLPNNFKFLPEFNWVLPQTIEDSHIIINTFMYRFDFGYDLANWFRLRLGTSILHMNQQGRGGKTTEGNGNGTSTFYYPDENRSSLNNTIDLGYEFILFENLGLRQQTYIYSLFKEERRQVSYTLFLTYYWENKP